MKNLIHLGKRWLGKSPGFTLAELMVAMAVGSFVMGGVFAVWTQLFGVTATNSNYMAAFRQVQNGGDWITRDALMAQAVYVIDTDPDTEDIMETAILTSDVAPGDDEISVDSTYSFPPAGVICIEDELIQYADKTDTRFEGCTRPDATDHDTGNSVTLFVALNWTSWSGDQHQIVYNLKEISHQLVRSHYVKEKAEEGEPENDFELRDTNLIAEAIDPAETSSAWNYDEKELEVKITSRMSGYVLGKHGIQSDAATRIYRIHPRPFF